MTLKISLIRWCASLVGVQMLCGILWVLGPVWPPLEPAPLRVAAVMALVLGWAAGNLLLDWRRARQEAMLADGLTGAAADESAAVSAKLATALRLMRKAKGRRFYLYEQPWYAIIGPPGAGKTTALMNAGLRFPLTDDLGPGAVAGVGGTRLCDWWFTDDAVLIDTAGRYTTQDSNRDVDRAGWDSFLTLLRRTRPKQPLNGVIVAIALSDIAGDTPGRLDLHARAIRARIDELEAQLAIRIPVYALVTKADLLIGFSEFFDDLDRTQREQIWGTTFPLAPPPQTEGALHPLLERLNRRVFQRLDAEDNADRRTVIAGFPAQLASVLTPLQDFAAKAFGPDAAGKRPLLRGLYLTSGTQEGTPIDRLMGAMSRSFGLDQRRAATLRPEAGRSYFLTALLRDVVFREAMLVAHRPGADRRRRMLRVAGFAFCVLLALGGAGFLWAERNTSLAAIAQTDASLAAQHQLASTLPLDPVADADLTRLLPWLDSARAATAQATPNPDRLGLAQDTKLAAARQAEYRHALEYALLPRLIWRTETQMRGMLGQADALYEATRVYLMLGGGGPLDPALVQDWFVRDWAQTYPGEDLAPLRATLARHLTSLLAEPLPPVPLDGPLVALARTTIGRVPLAARAYSRLKPLAASSAPPWRPSDALGPAGLRIFLRLSGRGLEEGIPGLYTIAGFRDGVLPALARAAQQAAAEGWVLGELMEPDSPRRRSLEADILTLYAAEYTAAWDGMLADLDPVPLHSLTQATQDLFILASPHSPVRALVESVAKELAPATAAPAALRPAMAPVDQHFQPFRALLGTGGAAPIDLALRPLGDLQQQLAKQAASASRTAPAAGEDPAAALRAEALRQPQPVARWLTAMATGGAALRDGGPRGAMVTAWNATGGAATVCPAVIGNHYPFVPTATADASVEDFTRLLGPGGAIDAFFNTQLKPYVDMKSKPWRLQPVDGINAPLTPADLAQFQRAADIRDLFFPAGSKTPVIRFDVTPGTLDPAATGAVLDIGGSTVTAARNGTARPAALNWPSRTGSTAAHLTIQATPPAQSLQIDTEGPWAMWRLFSRAAASGTGEHTTLTFTGNDRTARFDLRANPNPFGLAAVAQFRCPTVQ
jgi:type VI secretion system protein ImpL